MDVRHIVVLGKLLGEEGLATAWRPNDDDLHGSEPASYLKLSLDQLDAGRKAGLAQPLDLNEVGVLFFSWRFLTLDDLGVILDEERTGDDV